MGNSKPVIVRLADNVPVRMKAKYADIFTGEHGPQIRFRGAVKGGEQNAAIYMDAAAGLRELVACGALEGLPRGYDETQIPQKGFDLRMGTKVIEILREKPAGSTKSHLKIALLNADGTAAAPRSASTSNEPRETTQAAPATAPASNGNGNGQPERGAVYKRITSFVLDEIKPLYINAGLQFDADVASRCAQTLYIQAMEKSH